MENTLFKRCRRKAFVGKDIQHVAVYKKNDTRTIYNVLYRDGLNGDIMMKRCAVTGTTRDKEYDINQRNARFADTLLQRKSKW
jgi:topoisomerase-4 subunit A